MVLFRSAVKQIARRHGYHATFMCRPKLPNVFASGWHLHQSLVSRTSGENAFMARGGGRGAEPVRPRLSRRPAGARPRLDRVHDADHQRLQALSLLFAGAGPRDLGPRQPRRHDPRARRRGRCRDAAGEPDRRARRKSLSLHGLANPLRARRRRPQARSRPVGRHALRDQGGAVAEELARSGVRAGATIRSSARRWARSSSTTTSTSRTPRSSASRPRCRTGSTANISRCFDSSLRPSPLVMPGIDPGIHVLGRPEAGKTCDGRVKPGHDGKSNSRHCELGPALRS